MPVEVCFLLDVDGVVLWSDQSRSATQLPDSAQRWRRIWAERERIDLIAHSHPDGPLAFSIEDRSTMVALDAGLGRPLRYAVVNADGLIYRECDGRTRVAKREPDWVRALRAASGMEDVRWQC